MPYKTCRDCGTIMLDFEVHLLDEVYEDCFYTAHYCGFCCPFCGRIIQLPRLKNEDSSAKRTFSTRILSS